VRKEVYESYKDRQEEMQEEMVVRES